LHDVSVWEALDRICAAGDVGYSFFGPSLQVGPQMSQNKPSAGYAGPFRLQLDSISYNRTVQPSQMGPFRAETLSLQVTLLREPRVPLVEVGQPRVTEARDDNGKSLLAPSSGGEFHYHVNSSFYALNLSILLKPADHQGGKLALLKGTLPVEVRGRQEVLVNVPNLARGQRRVFRGRQGHELIVDNARQNGNSWTLNLRLRGPANWKYDPNTHGLELIDARGRRSFESAWLNNQPSLWRGQAGDFAWLASAPQAPSLAALPWPAFALPRIPQGQMEWHGNFSRYTGEPLTAPVQLRLVRFVRLKAEVPFELRDVPLP
jgi:hypothetical protein